MLDAGPEEMVFGDSILTFLGFRITKYWRLDARGRLPGFFSGRLEGLPFFAQFTVLEFYRWQ
jgi:hypothetical protein